MIIWQHVRALSDRLVGWACVIIGATALGLGFIGARSTPYVAEQVPYVISGGMFGIFLLGLGATLLLSADLRDQWHVLLNIRDGLAAPTTESPGLEPLPEPACPQTVP